MSWHLVDKIVIMKLLSQEKKKGCFVLMYQWGLWSLIYTLMFCVFFFYKLTQKHPWLMTSLDACLVSYFCSHQKCCQFVLYWWTDLIHKKKRYQKMPPCLAVPCGNSRGKIPSIISIPQCLQVSSSALRISKSHPWYGLDIFWKWKMRWMWMRFTVYLS